MAQLSGGDFLNFAIIVVYALLGGVA